MVKQGCKFLERQGYIPADAQGNKSMLTHTLLLIAHCTPPSIIPKGIQVVATLLENEAAANTTEGVTVTVKKKFGPLLSSVEQVTDTMQSTIMDTRQATNMLFNTCKDAQGEIYKAAEALKDEVQKAIEGMRDEVHKAA